MDELAKDKELDGRIAAGAKRPHDEHGHFMHVNDLLSRNTSVSKTNDDSTLVDVHVGNPLRKITSLLEEIKKQKAFTFNLKGSLGAAGILLVLTTFGIFGGTRAFCAKGEQSHLGTLTVLTLPKAHVSWWGRAQAAWGALVGSPVSAASVEHRVVLIENDNMIYRLIGADKSLQFIENTPYIATGDVDSCTQTITLSSPQSLQAR